MISLVESKMREKERGIWGLTNLFIGMDPLSLQRERERQAVTFLVTLNTNLYLLSLARPLC